MIRKYRFLLSVALICFSSLGFGQVEEGGFSENDPNYEENQTDSIRKSRVKYIRFSITVKKGRSGLENAKVQFYKKDEPTAMITTYKKGRSTFKLNINSEYIIRVSYPGQSSRTISFNTNIPDENLLDVWPSYSFNVKLMDGISSEQQLSKPYVRIKYNPNIYDFEPGAFEWSMIEEREEVKSLITDVIEEYQEEEALIALEQQQAEVALQLSEERAATEQLEQNIIEEQKALDRAEAEREREYEENLTKESISLKNELNAQLEEINRIKEKQLKVEKTQAELNKKIKTKAYSISVLSGSQKEEAEMDLISLKEAKSRNDVLIKEKQLALIKKEELAYKTEEELIKLDNQLGKTPRGRQIEDKDFAELSQKLKGDIKVIKQEQAKLELDKLDTQERIASSKEKNNALAEQDASKVRENIQIKKAEISNLTNELASIEAEEKSKKKNLEEYKRSAKQLEKEYNRMRGENDPNYAYKYHSMDLKRLSAERDYTSNMLFRLNKEQELLFAEKEQLQLYKSAGDDSYEQALSENKARLKNINKEIESAEIALSNYENKIEEKNKVVDQSSKAVNKYEKQQADLALEARQKELSEAKALRKEQEAKEIAFKSEVADLAIEQNKIQNKIDQLKEDKLSIVDRQIPIDDKIQDLRNKLQSKSGIELLELKAEINREEVKSLTLGYDIARFNQNISDQKQKLSNNKIEQSEISIEFSESNSEKELLQEQIVKYESQLSKHKTDVSKYEDQKENIKKQLRQKRTESSKLKDAIAESIKAEEDNLANLAEEEAEKKRLELENQKQKANDQRLNALKQEAIAFNDLGEKIQAEIALLNKNAQVIREKIDKYTISIQEHKEKQLGGTKAEKHSAKLDELLNEYRSHQQKIKLNTIEYKLVLKEIEKAKNASDLCLAQAEINPNMADKKIKESNTLLDEVDKLKSKLEIFKLKQTELKDQLASIKETYRTESEQFKSSVAQADKDQIESNTDTYNNLNINKLKAEKQEYAQKIEDNKKKIQSLESKEESGLRKGQGYSNQIKLFETQLSNENTDKKIYSEYEILQLELKKLRNDQFLERIQTLTIGRELENNYFNQKINILEESIKTNSTNINDATINASLKNEKDRKKLKLDDSKRKYNDLKALIAQKENEIGEKEGQIAQYELNIKSEATKKRNEQIIALEASLDIVVNEEKEIQGKIKSENSNQSKYKQKSTKLKTIEGQLANQKKNLSGGSLVIKEYEIARNTQAILRNKYRYAKSLLEESKLNESMIQKRLERIKAEKELKRVKPYQSISKEIQTPSLTQLQLDIDKYELELGKYELELKKIDEALIVKKLKAKKATDEAKLQAKLKLEKLKKERLEKERKEKEAQLAAQKLREENRKKQELRLEAQRQAASKPLEVKTNTYQEGNYKVQKTVVLSRQQDDIYVKKMDSSGRVVYRKNDRPITKSTYELELRRLRDQLDEYD